MGDRSSDAGPSDFEAILEGMDAEIVKLNFNDAHANFETTYP